jgi:hypothetical protein
MLVVPLYQIVESICGPIFERTSTVEKLPSGWKAISKYLTPEERGSQRKDLVANILSVFKKLPSDEEFAAAAKAGEAKKGWYASSAKAIQNLFGPDTPRFCALLASTSPQVSVTENMRIAMRIWRRWIEAGRPLDPKAIDAIGEDAIGSERWHKMGWRPNAQRALTTPDEDLPKLALSGNKVNSFRKNLLGDLAAVTNDAWMANFALIDQSLFGSLGGYSAYTAKVRRVAETLGWQPAEVQETVWSFFKALYEKQHIGHTGQDVLKDLKDSDVANVPDFAKLMMEDADVRKELDRIGLAPRGGSPGEDVRAGGPEGQGPLARAEQGGLAGHIAGVADRAAELHRRRELETLVKFSYPLPRAEVAGARKGGVTLTVTDPGEVAALRQLEAGQPLTKVIKTQRFGVHQRDTPGLLVNRKGDKWLIIRDAKVTLIQDGPTGTEVRLSGAVEPLSIPSAVLKPAR